MLREIPCQNIGGEYGPITKEKAEVSAGWGQACAQPPAAYPRHARSG
jgi:hypothetical protein